MWIKRSAWLTNLVMIIAIGIFSNYVVADGIDKELIQRYLPEDAIIIEAGAHVGIDTIDMAYYWPKSKIFAFEPACQLFKTLLYRTRNIKNIVCLPYALSDHSGKANFYVSSGASDRWSSLLQPHEHLKAYRPTVLFNDIIEVETFTLDDWTEYHGILRVDFLWLDMQGTELAMLKASPKILKTVKVIQIEVSTKELYHGSPLYPEVRAWLEQNGFTVVYEAMGWAYGGDVLFVRA